MKVGITFGRFTLVHSGHIKMIREMLEENDFVYIGISRKYKNLRSLEVLRSLINDSRLIIAYSSTPWTLMDTVRGMYPWGKYTYYCGVDRSEMALKLMTYFNNTSVKVLVEDNSYKTRACNEILGAKTKNQQLIDQGLAINDHHAKVIIAQHTLGKYA